MDNEKIELANIIGVLRREIQTAREAGQDEDVRFQVDEAEVEIQFTATRDVNAEGGVSFWVYTAKAEGAMGSQDMQRLKLKLKPIGRGGEDVTISSKGHRSKRSKNKP